MYWLMQYCSLLIVSAINVTVFSLVKCSSVSCTLGSKHLLLQTSQLSTGGYNSRVSITGSNIIITWIIVFILKKNNNREKKKIALITVDALLTFFSLWVTTQQFFLKVNQKLILLNLKPPYRKKINKIQNNNWFFFFSIFHFDWCSLSSLIFHSWKKKNNWQTSRDWDW